MRNRRAVVYLGIYKEASWITQMGGCQNFGPFLGTLNIRARTIMGTQKRDQNFDNHPNGEEGITQRTVACSAFPWC